MKKMGEGRSSQHWLCCDRSKDGVFVSLITDKTQLRSKTSDFRYSPIYPAYYDLREHSPSSSVDLSQVTFLVSRAPHQLLGEIKSARGDVNNASVFISHGLAAVIVLNQGNDWQEIFQSMSNVVVIENWNVNNDGLIESMVWESEDDFCNQIDWTRLVIDYDLLDSSTRDVYLEQIASSVNSLAHLYCKVAPEELDTLYAIIQLVNEFCNIISKTKKTINDKQGQVEALRDKIKAVDKFDLSNNVHLEMSDNEYILSMDINTNHKYISSCVSQLIELSASMSYSVTQGGSGIPPILDAPSPFPHFRLLGIGTAVRALTKFVRHIEAPMHKYSATETIVKTFSDEENAHILSEFSNYKTSELSIKTLTDKNFKEVFFDSRGDFPEVDPVPLLTYFSLRHGFKESSITVTAASESLTHELHPHWTLMTLSHEVMHSRVRGIIESLMIYETEDELKKMCERYLNWHDSKKKYPTNLSLTLVIYFFCQNWSNAKACTNAGDNDGPINFNSVDMFREEGSWRHLREFYQEHSMVVIELLVHYHDFIFIYNSNRELYFQSVWTSWSKVQAVHSDPTYYLVRSLATAALSIKDNDDPVDRFSEARTILLEQFYELEKNGLGTELLTMCRKILEASQTPAIDIDGYPGYSSLLMMFKATSHLLDYFSLYFTSKKIVGELHNYVDKEEHQVHNLLSVGDDEPVNPLQFLLASVNKSLNSKHEVSDGAWLSAWNFIVVGS